MKLATIGLVAALALTGTAVLAQSGRTQSTPRGVTTGAGTGAASAPTGTSMGTSAGSAAAGANSVGNPSGNSLINTSHSGSTLAPGGVPAAGGRR
jgi:hypothetical protein